jgi:hypothetical protein
MLVDVKKGIHVETTDVLVLIEIVYLEGDLQQSILLEIHKVFDFFNESLIVIVDTEVKILTDNFSNLCFVPSREVRCQIIFV